LIAVVELIAEAAGMAYAYATGAGASLDGIGMLATLNLFISLPEAMLLLAGASQLS